jgi:hypothetical protein
MTTYLAKGRKECRPLRNANLKFYVSNRIARFDRTSIIRASPPRESFYAVRSVPSRFMLRDSPTVARPEGSFPATHTVMPPTLQGGSASALHLPPVYRRHFERAASWCGGSPAPTAVGQSSAGDSAAQAAAGDESAVSVEAEAAEGVDADVAIEIQTMRK